MGIAFAELPAPRDPLLAALIEKLPAPGTVWPRDDRTAWLSLMSAAFDLVYGRDGAPPMADTYAEVVRRADDRASAESRGAPARVPKIRVEDDESAVAA